MKIKYSIAALFLVAGLAGCSGEADTAQTTAAPAPDTTAAQPAETSEAAAATETAAASETTEAAGEFDASKGGQVTCGQWRDATREQKEEAVIVYLTEQGLPAESADAALASIDIDVYCAGTSHENDPIEPGFQPAE